MSAPTVSTGGRRRRTNGSGYSGQPERLPAPTRERRPALAALAVLLIVGGALVSALIALRSAHRIAVLEIARDVPVGHQMTAADFTEVDISPSSVSGGISVGYIPAEAKRSYVGRFARTALFKHEVALGSMFGNTQDFLEVSGAATVGVVLSANQMPSVPIRTGDVVEVFEQVTSNGSASSSGGSSGTPAPAGPTGAPPAKVLLTAARVVDVAAATGNGGLGSTTGTDLSLLVPQAQVAQVVNDAAAKVLSVALLPPNVTPLVDYTQAVAGGELPAPTTSAPAPAPTTTAGGKK